MPDAPDFLDRAAPPAADLAEIRRLIRDARDLEQTKTNLAERTAAVTEALHTLYHQTLPDLFAQAQTRRVTLEGDGNNAAVTVEVNPFIRAAIPKTTADDAFAWLEANGHGDLIKHVLTLQFGREACAQAQELATRLTDEGYAVTIGRSVHHATLTAWLKEQVERNAALPPLEIIGGFIGRKATLKTEQDI